MKNIDWTLLQCSIPDPQRSSDFCESLVVPIRYERTFVPAFCAKVDDLVPPAKQWPPVNESRKIFLSVISRRWIIGAINREQ